MKISFISLGISTDAIGPRILSALLKQKGHKTQLIFLSTIEDVRRRANYTSYNYSEKIFDQVAECCQKSDIIGISLMTHHYTVAVELTKALKRRLDKAVIWGGIHPTICPEECLMTADLVCVGEAETSLIELASRIDKGEEVNGVVGIWSNHDGQIVRNGAGPLAHDLDNLPFPDYSFQDHHIIADGELQPMTIDNWYQHLLKFFPPLNKHQPNRSAYQVLSARGCPYDCTFCGEAPLMEKNGIYGRKYFRKRSIESLIKELHWACTTFPFIGEICFCDDTFASRPLSEIQEFSRQYREKICHPFYILISPANVDKQKIDILVNTGLTNVGMGIQTGSQRTISLYNREKAGNVERILNAVNILNRYKDRLMPYYDFIVENPYETNEDLLDTIRLLIKLPRPCRIRVYAMSFFPGTELYKRAKIEGIINDIGREKTFGQRNQGGYLNFVIDISKYLILFNLPKSIVKLLISKPFLFLLGKPFMDRKILRAHILLKRLKFKFGSHEGLS